MNILIIPDVHGRPFWRKAKELTNQYQQIIFLGDYLDPYKYENITPDMAYAEFLDIIKFKKKYPKKVTLLLGNHDLHYLLPLFVPSSRKNYLKAAEYQKVFEENKELFTCFKTVKSFNHKWVFSHAGITQGWLRQNKLSLAELLEMPLEELLNYKGHKYIKLLEQVSYYRGGINKWGSPVWMDIHEELKSPMVIDDKTTQIVGHNQLADGIYKRDGVYFTDCRKLISLNTKTKEVSYA